MRKASINGGLDEVGRKEGERHCHVDLSRCTSRAAALGIGRGSVISLLASGAPAQSMRTAVPGSRIGWGVSSAVRIQARAPRRRVEGALLHETVITLRWRCVRLIWQPWRSSITS
jgi:hypothetical protein